MHSVHDDSATKNSPSDPFEEFVGKIPGCVNAVHDSLTPLNQCYHDLHCTHTDYVALRTRLYSEATMYHQDIFPRTVKFMQDLKNLLGIYPHVQNEAEFADSIRTHIDDIKHARGDADELRRCHNFVMSNLTGLEASIFNQQRRFSQLSNSEENYSEAAAKGCVATAGMAAGLGVMAISLAAVGTTTTVSVSAGIWGAEVLAVTAAAPVVRPFVLADGLIGGLAVVLGTVAGKKGDYFNDPIQIISCCQSTV